MLEDTTGHQVVEQLADGPHVLLEGGDGEAVRLGGFEVGCEGIVTDWLTRVQQRFLAPASVCPLSFRWQRTASTDNSTTISS